MIDAHSPLIDVIAWHVCESNHYVVYPNLHSAVGQLHLNKTGERRVSMNNKTVSNPKEEWKGEFPDGQWLQLWGSLLRAWVQSLMGELRSHKATRCSQKKKKKN